MAGGGCFSLVAFLDGRLRRTFVAAGLEMATLQVDNETTIRCWVPSKRKGGKPALLLLSTAGTSYGGFVAYHVARLYPEMVERVIIASSAVNRKAGDEDEFLKKAGAEDVVDVLLPSTTDRLRSLLKLVYFRPPAYIPNFLSNDFIHESDEN